MVRRGRPTKSRGKRTTSVTVDVNLLDWAQSVGLVVARVTERALKELKEKREALTTIEDKKIPLPTAETRDYSIVESEPELAKLVLEAKSKEDVMNLAAQYRFKGKRVGALTLFDFRTIKGKERM